MIARYPTHVHALSPVLTLQGAVAHSDMPLESGPTLYLPYSQQYLPGYLAWRRDDFKAYFAEHHVQLPLRKGDAGFFNPALFHGAGTNVSADIQRMANLLQVSSAFGRAMEQVDRARVVEAVYPALRASGLDEAGLANAVAASAEGYPFPTNLDLDQPVDGLTPISPGRARAPRAGRGLGAGRADRGHRRTTPPAGVPECRPGHVRGAPGRAGGAPHDQGGLDPLDDPRGLRVVDPVDQEPDRGGAEVVDALADAGELHEVEPGDLRVVVADHADVVGDAEAVRLEDPHGADRDQVVGRDHRGGYAVTSEDLPGRLLAGLVGEGAGRPRAAPARARASPSR